jgi:uncharacterized protein (UPF0548 family)
MPVMSEVPLVFCWSKPNRKSIATFISGQQHREFSYAGVGDSRRQPPNGFTVDHNRVKLGHGAETFERARLAIKEWKMFDIPWISLCWPDAPIQKGASVAVLVSHLGFWSLNACRIVYTIEEKESSERFGFAYGTLPDHGEMGEERFLVECNREDHSVWYDLLAFSRPRMWARVAYPFTRALQKRFARDSKAAMLKAVQGPLHGG